MKNSLPTFDDIKQAEKRIHPYIRNTPLEHSPALSLEKGIDVYLKLENLQCSGSFKTRGAFNRLLSLSSEEHQRAVVASTAGNHGIGLSYAAQKLNIPVGIFLPTWTDPAKLKLIRQHTSALSFFPNVESAREAAKEVAKEDKLTFVSAYNDPWMIAGAGTMALEIEKELTGIECIFLGVGGGGLAAGICLAAKQINPKIKIYGIQSENSPLMAHWLKNDKPVSIPLKRTIAEGLAVNMELDTITFPLLRNQLEDMVLVSETEISQAMAWAIDNHQMCLEGAGAATIAGIKKHSSKLPGKVVGVITGKNISLPRFYTALKQVMDG